KIYKQRALEDNEDLKINLKANQNKEKIFLEWQQREARGQLFDNLAEQSPLKLPKIVFDESILSRKLQDLLFSNDKLSLTKSIKLNLNGQAWDKNSKLETLSYVLQNLPRLTSLSLNLENYDSISDED
ncbi:hypothetical protein, partial [Staphylococcus aureus]|uniref:hypothetical protein n=1 Tax=Staphylococcus aureus TaxID=1280 RepID=UPI0039BEAF91